MLKTLKGPLAAAMLSSLAIVPASTVAFLGSADVAVAKSEKSSGGGGGKSNGAQSSGKSNGKSGSAGAKAEKKSASSGGSKARGHGGLDKFVSKLTGKDKTKPAKSKSAVGSAKVALTGPKERPIKDLMHPSNLGKMNGPLHANVNALIAHVKNGNTNGPIGGMAALAVAGYAAEGAEDTLSLYTDFAELDRLLTENGYIGEDGDPDLQAYLDALQDMPPNPLIDDIELAIVGDTDARFSLEDALKTENNMVQDFATVDDYIAWRDGSPGATPIDGADTLITDLEGQERPGDEEVDFANQVIGDRTAAEDYMLSIWNKGDGDDTMRSEAENELLTILYDRIAADGETLDSAIEEHADLPEPPAPDADEEVAECSADDTDCTVDEEIASAD